MLSYDEQENTSWTQKKNERNSFEIWSFISEFSSIVIPKTQSSKDNSYKTRPYIYRCSDIWSNDAWSEYFKYHNQSSRSKGNYFWTIEENMFHKLSTSNFSNESENFYIKPYERYKESKTSIPLHPLWSLCSNTMFHNIKIKQEIKRSYSNDEDTYPYPYWSVWMKERNLIKSCKWTNDRYDIQEHNRSGSSHYSWTEFLSNLYHSCSIHYEHYGK